jgi:hypothetical protein
VVVVETVGVTETFDDDDDDTHNTDDDASLGEVSNYDVDPGRKSIERILLTEANCLVIFSAKGVERVCAVMENKCARNAPPMTLHRTPLELSGIVSPEPPLGKFTIITSDSSVGDPKRIMGVEITQELDLLKALSPHGTLLAVQKKLAAGLVDAAALPSKESQSLLNIIGSPASDGSFAAYHNVSNSSRPTISNLDLIILSSIFSSYYYYYYFTSCNGTLCCTTNTSASRPIIVHGHDQLWSWAGERSLGVGTSDLGSRSQTPNHQEVFTESPLAASLLRQYESNPGQPPGQASSGCCCH